MQTLATFDEKLATILIKELTTTSQTISVHRTAFDNLRFFGHGINRTLVMKSESVVHNAATQAFDTLCSRGNGHCPDGELDFVDLVLIASAAPQIVQDKKRLARGAREPSKFRSVMQKLGPGPTPTRVKPCCLQRGRRCRRATNSKAVGRSSRLTALLSPTTRSSPIIVAFM